MKNLVFFLLPLSLLLVIGVFPLRAQTGKDGKNYTTNPVLSDSKNGIEQPGFPPLGMSGSHTIGDNPANGSGSLGNIYSSSDVGLNYVSVSKVIGTRFSPSGSGTPTTLNVTGIPEDATVLKAFLWYGGVTNGADPDLVFNGTSYVATITGTSVDICWGFNNSIGFRADVTASVTGNGNYSVDVDEPDNNINGMTLMVIYKRSSASFSGTITIDDGANAVQGGNLNHTVTIPPPGAVTLVAKAFGIVADFQQAYGYNFNGVSGTGASNWWDMTEIGTSFASGATSCSLGYSSSGDCYVWIVAGAYYQLGVPCTNPTNGGTIGEAQSGCGSFTPATITGTDPTGYSGTLEYKWQSSVTGSGFSDISSSNSASYSPGLLTGSTWYKRLARVDCKSDWSEASESNVVKMTVEPAPVSGSLIKYPDNAKVCAGTIVTASFAPGSGGNGTDVLEFRTRTGSTWSDWTTYIADNAIETTGLTGVEIQTYRTADLCEDAAAVTVSWEVSPVTAGGAVTGGGVVCYGVNSTLLTLSGHTGNVLSWEWSVNGGDWTVIANTTVTYTPSNLTEDTWFRAVVKSGECLVEYSTPSLITMFTDYHVSGYAKYYNNPKTPLDGLKVTLKKGGVVQGAPVTTGANGYFNFGGLINGTYDLEITSAHPSGQWQTWNGCNNTDYLLVSRHATGVAYLQTEPPVVRVSADVVAPQTPPVINSFDATAVRNAAKYGWLNPVTSTPWFDSPKWVFSGTSSAAPIGGFQLNCANVTRDVYGLCSGDINGSYVPPSGLKLAEPSLDLVHQGIVARANEMVFPVKAEKEMEIGAITLMLDFNPQLLAITGVELANQQGDQPYFLVNGETLHIGWMSLDPIHVLEGQTLLLIHARLTGQTSQQFTSQSPIRFLLNPDPISELADGEGNVLSDVKLSVADAGDTGLSGQSDPINVYPNPVKDLLFLEGSFGSGETVSVELADLNGRVMVSSSFTAKTDGFSKLSLDVSGITRGVYLLKLSSVNHQVVKKVMIVK